MASLYPQIHFSGVDVKMNDMEDNAKNFLTASKMENSSSVAFLIGQPGNSETFFVNRAKVTCSSCAFKKLVDGFAKKDSIVLQDVTPRAFKKFLMFINKGNFNLENIEECVETWSFAREFELMPLENICQQFILLNLTASNACYVFYYANQMNNLCISKKCQELFLSKTKDVIESEAFRKADISTIETIIKSERLALQLEVDLFGALIQWAEQECLRKGDKCTKGNLRFILKPLFQYIRFLDMSIKDFVDIVVNSHILNESEEHALLINIANSYESVVALPEGISDVRCSRVSEIKYLKLYRRVNNNCINLTAGTEFQTTIKVRRGAIQVCRLYFPFMEKQFNKISGSVLITLKVYDSNDIMKPMTLVKGNFVVEDEDYCYVHCHTGTIREGETLSIKTVVVHCNFAVPVFKCTYYGNETVGSADITVIEEKEKSAFNFRQLSIFCKLPIYL